MKTGKRDPFERVPKKGESHLLRDPHASGGGVVLGKKKEGVRFLRGRFVGSRPTGVDATGRIQWANTG